MAPSGSARGSIRSSPQSVGRRLPLRQRHKRRVRVGVPVLAVECLAQVGAVRDHGRHVARGPLAPVFAGTDLIEPRGDGRARLAERPAPEDLGNERRGTRVGHERTALLPRIAERRTPCEVNSPSDCSRVRDLEVFRRPLAFHLRDGREDAQDEIGRPAPLLACVHSLSDGDEVAACLLDAFELRVDFDTRPAEAVEVRDDDPSRLAAFDAPKRLLDAGAVEVAARAVEVSVDAVDRVAERARVRARALFLYLRRDEGLSSSPRDAADPDVGVELHTATNGRREYRQLSDTLDSSDRAHSPPRAATAA